MSDFSSWLEVEAWLEKDRIVGVESWTFSKSYMCCWSTAEGDNCCEDDYSSVEEAVEDIKRLSDGKLERVNKL